MLAGLDNAIPPRHTRLASFSPRQAREDCGGRIRPRRGIFGGMTSATPIAPACIGRGTNRRPPMLGQLFSERYFHLHQPDGESRPTRPPSRTSTSTGPAPMWFPTTGGNQPGYRGYARHGTGISQLRVYMGLNVGSAPDDLVGAAVTDNLAKAISVGFLWAPVDATAQQAFMEMIAARANPFVPASRRFGGLGSFLRRRGQELRERVAHGTILRHGREGHRIADERRNLGGRNGLVPEAPAESAPTFPFPPTRPAYEYERQRRVSTSNRNLPERLACRFAHHVEIVDHDGQVGGIAGTQLRGAPLERLLRRSSTSRPRSMGFRPWASSTPRFMRSARGPTITMISTT